MRAFETVPFINVGQQLVSYRLILDTFCKKSVAIETLECHPSSAVVA